MVDIHEMLDTRGLGITVGMVNLPILALVNGDVAACTAAVDVFLPDNKRGVHLSRIPRVLQDHAPIALYTEKMADLCADLLDTCDLPFIDLLLGYRHLLFKLNTIQNVTVGYEVHQFGEERFVLRLRKAVMTVCPCALEATTGTASHSQRCDVSITMGFPFEVGQRSITGLLTEVLSVIDNSGSSPVNNILRRQDEAKLLMQAFERPRFIEDLVRDVVIGLRGLDCDYVFVEATSPESIHPFDITARAEWCNGTQDQTRTKEETEKETNKAKAPSA